MASRAMSWFYHEIGTQTSMTAVEEETEESKEEEKKKKKQLRPSSSGKKARVSPAPFQPRPPTPPSKSSEKPMTSAESSESFPALYRSAPPSDTSTVKSEDKRVQKKSKVTAPYMLDKPKELEEREKKVSELLMFARPSERTLFSEDAMSAFREAKRNRFKKKQEAKQEEKEQKEEKEEKEDTDTTGGVAESPSRTEDIVDIIPGQKPDLPSSAAPAEKIDVLREILKNFVTQSVQHAKELLRQVLLLRNNAREEIQKIKDKEEIIEDIEETLQWVMDVVNVHHSKLPEINSDATQLEIRNRQCLDHECQFCVCHQTTADTTSLTTENAEEALTATIQHCRRYMASLENVRTTYCEAVTMINQAQETVKQILGELVWGELGTSQYSELDEDLDDEIMDAVTDTLEIPDDTDELIKHADYLCHTIDTLTKEILATLEHTTVRMADIRTQNESLDKLEEITSKIRELFDVTALGVARTRSREKYLQTSRVLMGCVCPFCICYNSPFDDGTRTTSEVHREAQKEALKQSISRLQQMMRLVVTSVDHPDQPVVTAVDPQVLDLVEASQQKLYAALDIIVADERKRSTDMKGRNSVAQ